MIFDYKILLLGIIFASLIFIADIIFCIGAISLFYIILLLITFWFAKHKQYIYGFIMSSISLILCGWLFQHRTTEVIIDIGIFNAGIDYEALFRVFTIAIIVIVGGILVYQKSKEEELRELNETLELRILSRTVASESRTRRLEKQISLLQTIRKQELEDSLNGLDIVIKELKDLTNLEVYDA